MQKAVEAQPAAKKSAAEGTPTTPALDTPVPALDQQISNRQVWDKMMVYFEKSPFVYDVLMNSSVEFTTENEWTLQFAPGKEFYQIPAQNKLAELSAVASQFSGRTVTISLAAQGAAAAQKVSQKAAQKTTQKPVSQPAANDLISNEEPFALGPFDMPAASTETPQEVQDILDIFPGELMA